MNILIYTEENRLGTADIPPFIVGDSTTWTLMFQNAAGEFYSPSAVTMKLGHINGLPDGTYTNAFKWVDRCRNEHTASIVVTSGVPAVTWDTQPVGGMVGSSGVYVVRGQIPDGRITGVVANDQTIELTHAQLPPKTPTQFRFSEDAGGAGATGNLHWELKKYILRITITDGGTGYTAAPTVVFTGGDGDRAAATATISDCGSVVAIEITDNGCSYTSAPTVSFTVAPGNPGTGAAAICEWIDSDGKAGVTSIQVKTPGSGYITPPTITITDSLGTGSGAQAVALGWDTVSSIAISAQGTGYTDNPSIVIDAPADGIRATATITGSGIITRATYTGNGSTSFASYSDGQNTLSVPFSFTGGGGTGAKGVARFVIQASTVINQQQFYSNPSGGWGGSVASYASPAQYTRTLVGIDITNPGTGYTSSPTATLYGYTITGQSTFAAKITNPGSGYTSTPSFTITPVGPGSGMTTALTTGKITAIAVTNPGQDYTSPLVTITGGSSPQATATANVDGRRRYGVKYAEILSSGNAYTSTPYVVGEVTDGTASTNGSDGAKIIGFAKNFISSVQTGIEQSELPYKRAESSALVMGSVRMSGFSDGRYSSAGQLQYDHSALIVRPRSIATATLTAGTDISGNPIWSGTMDPINNYVAARLAVRRSTTLDLQVFGDGRMLFQGALTIIQKIQ